LLTGIVLLLALVVSGCGSDDDTPTTTARRAPTAIPATPTPRSTALPEIQPVAQIGERDRPLVILFALPDGDLDSDVFEASSNLRDYLERELELTVEVDFADSDAEALNALCGRSKDGYPTAIWASPFTLIAAEEQCDASPALSVARGRGTRTSIGITADIIARADITDFAMLSGQSWCRIDGEDTISWVLPGLVLAAEEIDIFTDISAIRDYEDNVSLARAIYDNECAAAALPPDEFEDILDDLADDLSTDENPVDSAMLADAIHVLSPAGDIALPNNLSNWRGYEASVIPYEVLIFPRDSMIPPALRTEIVDAILDFSASNAGEGLLQDILDASSLIDVRESDESGSRDYYAAFRRMLNSANWNMAENG
jgi:ABC-type phosphate/phosphonate transport system substrate-binding protein